MVLAALYFLPWKNIDWGKISVVPTETVTVSGQAQSVVKNQIAGFSAGVTVSNNDKATAVNEVNSKMTVLVKAVKDFGIKEADIQTQQASVYQDNFWYVEGGVSKSRKGQWTANNSIEITLRNVDRAQQLTDLLNTSGATNVYGPNFRMDDTNQAEKSLYAVAMKDAMDKADIIARASGRKLGRVLTVSDNGSSSNIVYPMMARTDMAGGAVPAPVEAGSTTLTKNLTVSFELE